MRKVVAYFIKYPVAVNVMMIAMILFGLAGIRATKSSFFPVMPSNIIMINTSYPGASPEEMEEGIVLKIEENLRGLIGVDRVTSVSRENSATITVEALEDYDIDLILQDVKNAVDQVPNFPPSMEPPVISKMQNRNEAISFTVSGQNIPLKTLKQIARNIETDLRTIDGVSQIDITGFPAEEIEIAVREKDMRAYQLTFDEVARAVASSNILTTGGNIKTESEEYLIRANNRSYYGDELDFIVVRTDPSGQVVRLHDIATVRDRWSEVPDRLYYNGDPAVQVRVLATDDEDLITNADAVAGYIETFNQKYPNINLNVTRDASLVLKQRTQLLLENGGMGILLVLILLSIFLRPSLAFWVAIGIPISFFGMFIFAPVAMTINVLSLFGMIIVIGILVDDGIVIGENIYQHYEKGKSPIKAAIDGTMEVMAPIISAILTTIVAFSTFFFLDGRIGNFFSEVSLVVIITLSVSLIEALVILPAHIAHSNAMKKQGKRFLINRFGDTVMDFLRDKVYAPVLRFFMTYKFLGFAIPIALLIISLGAIGGGIVRTTFFPSIASDRVSINLAMPQGTTESITDSIISVIERATWAVNEDFTARQSAGKQVVENTIRRIGPGTANASLEVNLLPGEERDFPSIEIANAIEEEVGPIYGVESIEYGSGGNFGGKPFSLSLTGSNIQDLKGAKNAVKEAISKMPELKDISDNDPAGIKEIKIDLKESAHLMGLTYNDVMAQVRSGFFGQSVQRFQRGQDEIRVWVRYDRDNRSSIKNLDDMWIVTPTQGRVALSEIADYSIARGDISINHLEGKREIRIDANLKDRDESATDILAGVRENVMPEILARYPTVTPLYEGQRREAGKLLASVNTVVPAVLFMIYAIIAFTFRSYSQPLLLFIMIPFSLMGVTFGHWIHGFSINMLSWLGIIALIGIMVNDGLVLIGKFNTFLKEGLSFEDALYEAGKSRFRAIFLTSLTTIAGLAPLIFETSRQAQFLIPMAISIAYGIAVATFLTLLMLPLLLSLNNYLKVGRRWLFTGVKPSREEMERAVREKKAEQEEHLELV